MKIIKSYLLAAASLLTVASCSHGHSLKNHDAIVSTQVLAASMAASVSEYWGALENCEAGRAISVMITSKPEKATLISLNQINDRGNTTTFWRARKRTSIEMADSEFQGTQSSVFAIRNYEVIVNNEVFEEVLSKMSISDILTTESDRRASERPPFDGPFFGSRIDLCDQGGFVTRTTNSGFRSAIEGEFKPFIDAARYAIPELTEP